MESIKKTLKERAGGLLLIVFAVFIITGISISSHQAESKNGQSVAGESQVPDEGQILGEANDNPEEITDNSEEISQEAKEDDKNADQEEKQEEKTEDEKNRCDDLQRLLKKYCGKNYNVKKCRSYLLETKDLSKKDSECKSLYKKYHFVPKKEDEKDNDPVPTNSSDVKEEIALTINYGGGKTDDKYTVSIVSGMTVMDAMRKAKENSSLTYDESRDWAGYIQEINGVREDLSKSIFWMLYYNGAMAAEGASTLKIKSGDKIEWRYMTVSW